MSERVGLGSLNMKTSIDFGDDFDLAELESCAIRIQKIFRGHQASRQVKDLKTEANGDSTFAKMGIAASAATRKDTNSRSGSISLPASARKRKASLKPEDFSKKDYGFMGDMAAILLQSNYRRYKARASGGTTATAKKNLSEDDAAAVIQRGWRCHVARATVLSIRDETMWRNSPCVFSEKSQASLECDFAAQVIQRGYRCHAARCRVDRRRRGIVTPPVKARKKKTHDVQPLAFPTPEKGVDSAVATPYVSSPVTPVTSTTPTKMKPNGKPPLHPGSPIQGVGASAVRGMRRDQKTPPVGGGRASSRSSSRGSSRGNSRSGSRGGKKPNTRPASVQYQFRSRPVGLGLGAVFSLTKQVLVEETEKRQQEEQERHANDVLLRLKTKNLHDDEQSTTTAVLEKEFKGIFLLHEAAMERRRQNPYFLPQLKIQPWVKLDDVSVGLKPLQKLVKTRRKKQKEQQLKEEQKANSPMSRGIGPTTLAPLDAPPHTASSLRSGASTSMGGTKTQSMIGASAFSKNPVVVPKRSAYALHEYDERRLAKLQAKNKPEPLPELHAYHAITKFGHGRMAEMIAESRHELDSLAKRSAKREAMCKSLIVGRDGKGNPTFKHDTVHFGETKRQHELFKLSPEQKKAKNKAKNSVSSPSKKSVGAKRKTPSRNSTAITITTTASMNDTRSTFDGTIPTLADEEPPVSLPPIDGVHHHRQATHFPTTTTHLSPERQIVLDDGSVAKVKDEAIRVLDEADGYFDGAKAITSSPVRRMGGVEALLGSESEDNDSDDEDDGMADNSGQYRRLRFDTTDRSSEPSKKSGSRTTAGGYEFVTPSTSNKKHSSKRKGTATNVLNDDDDLDDNLSWIEDDDGTRLAELEEIKEKPKQRKKRLKNQAVKKIVKRYTHVAKEKYLPVKRTTTLGASRALPFY